MTTLQAIQILKKIPASAFIKLRRTNGIDKCCATGYLRQYANGNKCDFSSNGVRFNQEVDELELQLMRATNYRYSIPSVNDTSSNQYPQVEIKDRVLAFLGDHIKKGEPPDSPSK